MSTLSKYLHVKTPGKHTILPTARHAQIFQIHVRSSQTPQASHQVQTNVRVQVSSIGCFPHERIASWSTLIFNTMRTRRHSTLISLFLPPNNEDSIARQPTNKMRIASQNGSRCAYSDESFPRSWRMVSSNVCSSLSFKYLRVRAVMVQ